MPDDDRDALSWEGDGDDDSLVTGDELHAAAVAAPAVAAGTMPEATTSTRALRFLFLVVALASTAGWVVVIVGNPVQAQTLLGMAFYQLGELLAVLTPVFWWLLALRLARGQQWWWLAGAVVTAPWPLLVGVLA